MLEEHLRKLEEQKRQRPHKELQEHAVTSNEDAAQLKTSPTQPSRKATSNMKEQTMQIREETQIETAEIQAKEKSQEVTANLQVSPHVSISMTEREVERDELAETRKLAASLTLDEVKILRFLVERGGEAYQMEIYKTLGMPKSTVTKIIRRLSERGLLTVERRGRYNYVKLIDKDKIGRIVREAELLISSTS